MQEKTNLKTDMTVENIMKLAREYALHFGLTEGSEKQATLLAAVEELAKDAERLKFIQENMYLLPYDDHGCGPEFDLSNEAIEQAMKGQS